MKKYFYFLYALVFVFLTGCVTPVDNSSVAFLSEEIFLPMNEYVDMPLEIIGYDIDDITFTVADTDILRLGYLRMIPLSVGSTTITAAVKNNPDVSATLKVFVQGAFIPNPRLITSVPILSVGQRAKVLILNEEILAASTDLDLFEWKNSDNTVAVMDDDLYIEGLRVGTTTITATLRSNPMITDSYELAVVSGPVCRDNGKPVIGLRTEDDIAVIQAGESIDVFFQDENINRGDYKWRVISSSVARVSEDGRIFGCSKGVTEVYVYSKTDNGIYGKVCVKVTGVPDVDYISRLLAAAEGELGYREAKNGFTKYGYWYGIYHGENFATLDWCAMFVTWCANEAGIATNILYPYANVSVGRDLFQKNNAYKLREDYIPKAGDIIFFLRNGAGHTGIVTGCDGAKVYTIEGNTSDMVARREYALNHNKIDGYGTPFYPPFSS